MLLGSGELFLPAGGVGRGTVLTAPTGRRRAKEWPMAKKAKKACKLFAKGKLARLGDLARDARFICEKCGRAAAKAANLCKPREI